MSGLLWIVAGFLGGVIVSRNAAPMDSTETGAIWLCLIVACGIMWWAGYRGKANAVATATATATAIANAHAESSAKAAATSAITLVLGAQAGVSSQNIAEIVDQSYDEIASSRSQGIIDRHQEVAYAHNGKNKSTVIDQNWETES